MCFKNKENSSYTFTLVIMQTLNKEGDKLQCYCKLYPQIFIAFLLGYSPRDQEQLTDVQYVSGSSSVGKKIKYCNHVVLWCILLISFLQPSFLLLPVLMFKSTTILVSNSNFFRRFCANIFSYYLTIYNVFWRCCSCY